MIERERRRLVDEAGDLQTKRRRIDGVGDVHPHLAVDRPTPRMIDGSERVVERARAEGRPADADDDDIVEIAAHLARELERPLQLRPRVRQLGERRQPGAPLAHERRVRVGEPRRECGELRLLDAARNHVRHRRVHVDAQPLRLAPPLLPIPDGHPPALTLYARARDARPVTARHREEVAIQTRGSRRPHPTCARG